MAVISTTRELLKYKILLLSFMIFLILQCSEAVNLTILQSAVAKGAVCLDGSPPAYQLDKGFGDGVNSWLVDLQWGGWCDSVQDCIARVNMSNGLGSSKFMSEFDFTGILSNQKNLNPNFYNWNRVYMRYCDGSSFTGDVDKVDPVNNLHFRGARVFDVIIEELLTLGMKDAQNALLTGCSAGALASILNCDKFRGFLPSSTRVKCVPDAGYFAHVKDLSGKYLTSQYYDRIVTLHESAKRLPSGCTSSMKPGLCFYPQFVTPYINTPIFILNSAYDTWQVDYILSPNAADPNGGFTKCKTNLSECSATQIKRLEVTAKKATNGIFINTCYTHCQSETQSAWLGDPALKLGNKTMSGAVGDWFYDKSEFRKVDNKNVSPHYC
ncbi:pectin acetylesterase 8-like isoform X2 [Rutidosis leptorrhynchoides]|uniref:pectin acetylesterase 8-like isoform X2 n=1 Tax=Rutidosis leptorrhynchoides TaxID=125765 RepID=UPI003A99811B